MNDWFIWNGVRCTDFGIHVSEQPPLTIPKLRASQVAVPGKPGSLTVTEGGLVYEDVTKAVNCFITDSSRVPDIATWLRGSGKVTFANRPGGFFHAHVSDLVTFEQLMRGRTVLGFSVSFLCGPFWYAFPEDVTITEPGYYLSNENQLFRIYAVRRENDQIVVNARHIFYDLSYTLTTYENTGSHSLAYTLQQCQASKLGSWRITFRTNIKGTLSGAHYRDRNMIEAILDPDDGMVSRWKADVIRDNYDCYLIGQAGFDRGVVLEYGKDLLGVEYNVNWENIVTHIRPVGEDRDGKPLYITENKGLVVSSKAANYPFSRVGVLQVSDAKVQKDVMTVAEARARLRAAAQELLNSGADEPEISMRVDFLHLGSTQEYAAYHDLKRLYLFDTVRVVNRRLGVDSSALVKRIVWDCLLERLTEVELGTVTAIAPSVSSWQLGSVSGTKVRNGTLSGGALEDDAINVRHMQAGSVNADAIQARVITSEHVAAGAIQTEHLDAGSVTAQKLAAGAVTAEKLDADAVSARMLSAFNAVIQQLDAGHVQAQTLGAAIADLGVLTAGSATFDAVTVQHLVAEALNLEFGALGEVFIRNLKVAYAQMVSAAIGNLCIKASDGNYYTRSGKTTTGGWYSSWATRCTTNPWTARRWREEPKWH